MARSGRRPGPTESRDEILAAARRLFADRGYDGTTVRGIAREAGVDPALVHHFFGSKDRVFVAAMEFPLDPTEVMSQVVAHGREGLGERLAHFFLAAWADAAARSPMLGLLRSAMTNDEAAAMFREFIASALAGPVSEAVGVPRLRLEAAMAQLVGVALMRYVLQLEPMASASEDEVVALVAPTIQRYIDGTDVPG